jgi:hypothetical protein
MNVVLVFECQEPLLSFIENCLVYKVKELLAAPSCAYNLLFPELGTSGLILV